MGKTTVRSIIINVAIQQIMVYECMEGRRRHSLFAILAFTARFFIKIGILYLQDIAKGAVMVQAVEAIGGFVDQPRKTSCILV